MTRKRIKLTVVRDRPHRASVDRDNPETVLGTEDDNTMQQNEESIPVAEYVEIPMAKAVAESGRDVALV